MRNRWTKTEVSVLNRLTVLGASQRLVGAVLGRSHKAVERKVARLRTKFFSMNYRDALATIGYATEMTR